MSAAPSDVSQCTRGGSSWSCASINAAICASYAPALFVATDTGQPQPKCGTKALDRRTAMRFRKDPRLPCRQRMTLAFAPRVRRRDEKTNEHLVPLFGPSGRLLVASEDPVPGFGRVSDRLMVGRPFKAGNKDPPEKVRRVSDA